MKDAEWLKQHAPDGLRIDDDLIYDFSERVSIAVIDGGVELEQARSDQLRLIKNKFGAYGSKT